MYEDKNCWEILGIEPIRDKKSIKKAYAKKLKVTRPDADPEGFKRLNQAYQACLNYLENDWYWQNTDDCTDTKRDESTSKTAYTQSDVGYDINDTLESFEKSQPLDALNASRVTQSAASIGEQSSFNDIAKAHVIVDRNKQDELMQQLHRLIWDMSDRNNLSIWQKILDDDALLDISFKQQVSFFTIEKLLELRETQVKLRKSQYIPNSFILPSVMNYLSEFFDWHRNFQKIEQAFPYYQSLYYFLDDLTVSNDGNNTIDSEKERKKHIELLKQLEKDTPDYGSLLLNGFFMVFIITLIMKVFSGSDRYSEEQNKLNKQYLDELSRSAYMQDKYFYINEKGELVFKDESVPNQQEIEAESNDTP